MGIFHQIKGLRLPDIMRDQEIKTTPRFELSGKTQEQLESALVPRNGKGGTQLYTHAVEKLEGVNMLIWEKGEKPVVWLTSEEKPIGAIWKNGLNRTETFKEAEINFKGFYRIGIDQVKVEVFPWLQYEKMAKVSKRWRQILAAGAPDDDKSKWHFTLTPIPSSAWTVIERWEDSNWVPWQEKEHSQV